MNILFVVAYTPTPIRTRPYNILRTLTQRGHAVTLATLWENEPEAFAAEVTRLLQDALLRRRLGENGRRLVEARYDWRAALPKLETVYNTLAKGNR